jgi:hypothetical protein
MSCILAAAASVLYWSAAARSGIPHISAEYLYATPDAQSYRSVADWLCGGAPRVPPATTIRPLGYPLFLTLVRSVSAAPMAVVAAQFLLWIASVNLVAAAALRLTGRPFWGYLAGLIMMTNLSLIMISWRALSETCAVFVLSAWIYLIARIDFGHIVGWKIFAVLFPMALATVIRPFFFIPYVAMMVAAIAMQRKHWRALAWIAAASIPVAIQMGFMLSMYHQPTISLIGKVTFRNYYLRQVLEQPGVEDHEGMRESIATIRPVAVLPTLRFLAHNYRAASACYFNNLRGNIVQTSPDAPENSRRSLVINSFNRAYALMHLALFPMVVLVLFVVRDQARIKAGAMFLLFIYIIASCGIACDQSDRLTLTALPLWIVTYAVTISGISALAAPLLQGRKNEN